MADGSPKVQVLYKSRILKKISTEEDKPHFHEKCPDCGETLFLAFTKGKKSGSRGENG